MGISWYLEIMATLFDQHIAIWWTFADVWNLLQGVLVFFIFAFKRNVFLGLVNLFGREIQYRKIFNYLISCKLLPAPTKLKRFENKHKTSTTTSTTNTNWINQLKTNLKNVFKLIFIWINASQKLNFGFLWKSCVTLRKYRQAQNLLFGINHLKHLRIEISQKGRSGMIDNHQSWL